jgi:Zn-dependent protease
MNCPECATPWSTSTLACPGCRRLVHSAQLEALAKEAKSLETSDKKAALARWKEAAALLPPAAKQRAVIEERIGQLSIDSIGGDSSSDAAKAEKKPIPKALAALGVVGMLLWKLKFVLVFFLSKGKLLLLGLTKWKTALSMLLFLGVYWAAFGWWFALGIVLSIYVHEMGHVAEIRRRGMPASAPMFIPGVGAFVRLGAAPKTNIEDARIGLAGPWWGLAAALFCYAVFLATDSAIFAAIARIGAWINLFNLIPIWQLDGGRAFRSLTRKERMIATAGAFVAWLLTQESMLLLVLLGGLYRCFAKPFDEKGDLNGLIAYLVLLAVLSWLTMLVVPGMAAVG